MSRRIDLTGKKFGRLEVVRYHSTNAKGKALWECKCQCGKITVVIGENLKAGATKSCGCYRKEVEKVASVTHGLSHSNGKVNRLYSIWLDMKKRCNNPKNKEYKNYGGRGIKVCEEWSSNYLAFHEWALKNGYNEKLTLDRIDVNGNYSPENCKWSTLIEQGRNKRLSPQNTTGVSGVTFKKDRQLYVARISVGGKRIYLGEYKTLEEAREARKKGEEQYWG